MTANPWSEVKWIIRRFSGGSYYYKSSDKHASIGSICSHLKLFFCSYLSKEDNSRHVVFHWARAQFFRSPDLKRMRSVRCPNRNPDIVCSSLSPVIWPQQTMMYLALGSLGFKSRFIAAHQRCLTSALLENTCSCGILNTDLITQTCAGKSPQSSRSVAALFRTGFWF